MQELISKFYQIVKMAVTHLFSVLECSLHRLRFSVQQQMTVLPRPQYFLTNVIYHFLGMTLLYVFKGENIFLYGLPSELLPLILTFTLVTQWLQRPKTWQKSVGEKHANRVRIISRR